MKESIQKDNRIDAYVRSEKDFDDNVFCELEISKNVYVVSGKILKEYHPYKFIFSTEEWGYDTVLCFVENHGYKVLAFSFKGNDLDILSDRKANEIEKISEKAAALILSEDGKNKISKKVSLFSKINKDGEGTIMELTNNIEKDEGRKEVKLMKVNAKKRIVYGVVYAPEVADAHDMYMTDKTIEEMAHRWMIASRMMDEQHDFVKGTGIPVESFIVREGDKDFVGKDGKALVGAWVLGTKVTDERVWAKILKGDILAYSLAGVGELGKSKEMDSEWYDEEGNFVNPYDNSEDDSDK